MVSGAIGRVRDVVARVDPHAVLAFGKRRRVPVELRLRQDFVGLGRFDPASGPLAVKLDVIAKLVAVGIVHFPRHVKHAVVLGGFVSALHDSFFRLVRNPLRVGGNFGHHGA